MWDSWLIYWDTERTGLTEECACEDGGAMRFEILVRTGRVR